MYGQGLSKDFLRDVLSIMNRAQDSEGDVDDSFRVPIDDTGPVCRILFIHRDLQSTK